MSDAFKPLLTKVCAGHALSREDAETAFAAIMSGDLTAVQIAAFLVALKVRGETIDEITGAVKVMRAKMLPVELPPTLASSAIDIVGTGGDGKGSYNVSTATALVVAACGVPVAKHGNRAVSSISGAADVLKALGVNLELSPEQIATCIEEVGIGFMFAPMHHLAMKHVSPVRTDLGQRTLFNLVGPLSNPARATRQLIGVYDERWLVPLAQTLNALGSESAWIVYGTDGMDEVTNTGITHLAKLEEGAVTTGAIDPRDHGFELVDERELVGGDAQHNAAALRSVLAGQDGAYTDIVLLNAAAALCVAGTVTTFDKGIAMARQALGSGAAEAVLEKLVAISNAER
jgi:anthranilate phosphoribosyltransferase